MGRVLTFSDDDVIRMASEQCIPVVGDDWFQRRRRDAEGEFFRSVSNQGPRRYDGISGPTRQGVYVFTAGGKLLAYRNHHDPAVMRREIEQALKKFDALPESERGPGAVDVPDLPEAKLDQQYHRAPPEGGLVLRTHARVLDRNDDGSYANCDSIPSGVRGIFASRDHVWIQQAEWQAMAPTAEKGAKIGDVIELPEKIVQRLCRFHLIDNTRGEPPLWNAEHVRRAKMTMTVTQVAGNKVTLRLDGAALMMTAPDEASADRGFDVVLRGTVVFDKAAGRFTAFDAIALGEHWGDGTYDKGARPGRSPLGIVIEQIEVDEPADYVPPQASREIGAYYGRY